MKLQRIVFTCARIGGAALLLCALWPQSSVAAAGPTPAGLSLNGSPPGPPAAASQAVAPAAAPQSGFPLSGALPSVPREGYDVSFPQCQGPYPASVAFGIIGVNGGRAFTKNACIHAEYAWAQASTSTNEPHLSFYLNTGNPGPDATTHWPDAGTLTPDSCDGTWSTSCAYDYGWAAADDSLADAAAVNPTAAISATWWLDVETANSWSDDPTTNVAALTGEVDALRAAGITTIGIYSAGVMWQQLTGADAPDSPINEPFASLLVWLPDYSASQNPGSACADSFTGGRVRLVQYQTSQGYDADYACY